MVNPSTSLIDSGHRGNAIYHNYRLKCGHCNSTRAAYWLYADRRTKEKMESGKFEKEMHNCPACHIKHGITSSMKVIRKLTARESHFRLNKHKDPMYIPKVEDINGYVNDERKMDDALLLEEEKLKHAIAKMENGRTFFTK